MTMQVRLPEEPTDIDADAFLPTESGNFRIRVTVDEDGLEHCLVYVGELENAESLLIRIHSECLTGDAFGSMKCDCGPQLQASLKMIQEEGCGAVVYLRQEGRGIGLHSKIQAYALQDIGYDTLDANLALGLPADARTYDIAAKMLKSIGYDELYLLTNNPEKACEKLDLKSSPKDRLTILGLWVWRCFLTLFIKKSNDAGSNSEGFIN